ncbi:molybdate ABC transporter substrate-binding protein [Kaarinaea lacus]
MLNKRYQSLVVFLFFFGMASHCFAEQINIAVASNALSALKVISSEFEKQTGHSVQISSGSTGKLYAQIIHGAPYDIFLAANEREPKKLEQSHLIVPNSRFTYVLGKLVAWSSDASLLNANDINSVLVSSAVNRIAVANPKTAPYGLAAQQALQKLGVWNSLQAKIIRGENVSQTYQFAMTRNAQIGFVARSQIHNEIKSTNGSYWEVPEALYASIRQQAVLLLRAQNKTAAAEFIEFIRSKKVKEILVKQFGYGVESQGIS